MDIIKGGSYNYNNFYYVTLLIYVLIEYLLIPNAFCFVSFLDRFHPEHDATSSLPLLYTITSINMPSPFCKLFRLHNQCCKRTAVHGPSFAPINRRLARRNDGVR